MVEVKICGACRPEDARAASEAGATWVGVILAPGRTRTRTIEEAAGIFAASRVRRVGVFVDSPAQAVIDAARELKLDAVQLHGDESIDDVRCIRDGVACEIWKAIRVRQVDDLVRGVRIYRGTGDGGTAGSGAADARAPGSGGADGRAAGAMKVNPAGVDAILVDGWSPDAHGGAGVRFDWEAVARAGVPRAGFRLIVAGGLTADNVSAAVALLRPDVVDVSSGVEVEPGRKSPEMINAFIAAALRNGGQE